MGVGRDLAKVFSRNYANEQPIPLVFGVKTGKAWIWPALCQGSICKPCP